MSYNTPVSILQGGSVINVGPSGTLNILAGGSIQNAGGQSFSGSVSFSGSAAFTGPVGAPNLALGGTLGRWAFGTAGLTSALGTIATGLTRVIAATGNVISGQPSGAGSTTSVQVDLSLAGAGSVIFRTSIGTLPAVVDGTISWMAFGT
jgi:hypothetical protein